MAGERTPDTTPPNWKGSSDDEISLREHLQRQIDTQRYNTHERIEAEHEYFERRLIDIVTLLNERYDRQAEEAKRIAKEQAEALDKAERAIEKRFDGVNEFRAQLNDQAHTFMPRSESVSRHERNAEQLAKIEQHITTDIQGINRRLDLMQGQIQGAKESKTDMRAWVALGVTLVVAAVTIAAFIIANSPN